MEEARLRWWYDGINKMITEIFTFINKSVFTCINKPMFEDPLKLTLPTEKGVAVLSRRALSSIVVSA